MDDLKIRRFEEKEEGEVSRLIERNFLDINIKDYSEEHMKKIYSHYNENKILDIAKNSHMYVAVLNNKIVGCGAIASFLGKEDESLLLAIFVLPEFQGNGIGRKIIEALEKDEYYIRSRRIEVKSSTIACDFYKKMGFNHKYNLKELDKDGNYKLEKFRYRLQYYQNY
ncbi:GNAT family N-acetyltransferase [Clostridium sp.]|uniref:GNAT family N-acetyltransferase n=1 Tax=Clostridium sp. TaxID=1506 RepID=UPI0026071740